MGRSAAAIADLQRHKLAFDFTRDSLGERAAECAARAIMAHMDAETDPQGNPWWPLSRAYEAWKSQEFPGEPISVLFGKMKTADELKGMCSVQPHYMVQTYGVTDFARYEAACFSEGNERQPPRRFYEFNDLAIVQLEQLFSDHFHSFFR